MKHSGTMGQRRRAATGPAGVATPVVEGSPGALTSSMAMISASMGLLVVLLVNAGCSPRCPAPPACPSTCPSCPIACPSTEVLCASAASSGGQAYKCVDTQMDPQNCGACGRACGLGEVCTRGKCTSSAGCMGPCCSQWTKEGCFEPCPPGKKRILDEMNCTCNCWSGPNGSS